MFQSAPDQLIGRYIAGTTTLTVPVLFQSARDQLIGRYLPPLTAGQAPVCFNPRPTNLSGDTRAAALRRTQLIVRNCIGKTTKESHCHANSST